MVISPVVNCMKKLDVIILIVIILISIVLLKDLFKPGFYTSHDGIHQVVRLYYFDQAVKDGQMPPRWAGGLLNGFGYPLFIFSYHLPWFIAEPIHLIGLSIIDSIKLTFLLGFIFSGFTMYFFIKEVFGRLPAFTSSLLYLIAPYRFSNIFVRAAIGDATAFIFPPLIFLAIYKIKKSNSVVWKWVIIGSLALAGLMLSHAMVFLLFFISAALYTVFSMFYSKHRRSFLMNLILMLMLGFGLSSYYLIPSLIERKLTIFSGSLGLLYSVGSTFLNMKDLLYSPWGYGTMHAKEGGMSFQLGIGQWIIVFASFLYILKSTIQKRKIDLSNEGILFSIIFVFSIFLMLRISLPVWQVIDQYAFIDFPWRVLSVSVFSVAFLVGYIIHYTKSGRMKILISVILIFISVYANRNHLRINQTVNWPLDFYIKLEKTTNSYDEYIPKWVRTDVVEKPKPKIILSDSKSSFQLIKNTSNTIKFTVNAKSDIRATVNTIYYPGWEVRRNGNEYPFSYIDSGGPISFLLSTGKHDIELSFKETYPRKVANSITILAIMVVLKSPLLSIYKLIFRRKVKYEKDSSKAV